MSLHAAKRAEDKEVAEDSELPIPEPQIPETTSPLGFVSLREAEAEQNQLASRWFSPKTRETYDWAMTFVLKPVLFVIVVLLSWWWSVNVSKLVWASGKGWISLDKSVLVALVTTSVGNFITVVIIIAKNLFPDAKKR